MEISGPLFYEGLAQRNLTLAYVDRLEGECTEDAVLEIRQGFLARLAEPLRASARLQARGKAGTPASGPKALAMTPAPLAPQSIGVSVKTEPSSDFQEGLAGRNLTVAYILRLEAECTEDVVMEIRQGLEPPPPTGASPTLQAKVSPGSSKVQEILRKESRTLQIILTRCDEAEEVPLIPNPVVADEPEEPASPALFDPSVLERVFSPLNLEALLDCRQVCKAWDTEALRKIRKLTFVKLPVRLTKDCDLTSKRILNSKLAKFVHVMKSGQGLLPIANYSLKTEPSTPLDQPNLNQFFRLFGPSMACLEIGIFTSTDVSQLVAKIARHCPSLEVLRLTCPQQYGTVESGGHGEYEVRIPELTLSSLTTVVISGNLCEDQCLPVFEATPNLKAIKIGFYDNLPSYHWNKMLQDGPVLRALKMTGRLQQITEIRAEVLSFSSFQLLVQETQAGLSLEAFEAKVVPEDVTPEALEEFLTSHQQSLKSLSLGKRPRKERWRWSPPNTHYLSPKGMDSLTHVEMSSGESHFFLASEEPVTDFPHLHRVDISNVARFFGRTTRRVEFPLAAELRIKRRNGSFTDSDEPYLVVLPPIFPSIESLTFLYPYLRDVETAALAWPDLKKLNLKVKRGDYGDQNVDFGNLEDIRRLFPGFENFTRLETLSVDEDVGKKSVWRWEANRMDMNCPSFQPRLNVKFLGDGTPGGN